MPDFSLIITAGGTSSRYGTQNKLLEKIDSKTVIEHSVLPFLNFKEISEVIIPANISIINELKEIFSTFDVLIIEGGKTRQESVYKALGKVKSEYVIIHDGARPLINEDIISTVIKNVIEKKAVTVMTKTTDTIKEVDKNGKIIRTIDRSKLYNTQTPQAFETSLIKNVHEMYKFENFTDDSSMLEHAGKNVFMVEGTPKNIKITSKSDLDFAKIYI